MAVGWQDVVALVVVLAAAGHLGYRGWQLMNRRSGGSCGCGAMCPKQTAASQPLVQIIPLAVDTGVMRES